MADVEIVPELGVAGRVINTTDLPTRAFAEDRHVQALARDLASWVDNSRSYPNRANTAGSMFDRTIYMPSQNPYELMRSAKVAVDEDDIVGGAADLTTDIAMKGGHRWESSVPDDADIFNQIGAELELDAKLRQLWREDFTYGQAVVAKLWDWREYTVRGTTSSGNKRKKQRRVWTPVRLVLLSPMHTVPIGWGPLREDRLAWQASDFEVGRLQSVSGGGADDPLMQEFFTGLYCPDEQYERARLGDWGVQHSNLLEMRPGWVFRHAPLRPDYEPFAPLPMRSLFALLDLKRQQMLRDRAALVGAANYILLLRKGTDDKPAQQAEMEALQQNYQFLAKVPVIVSDHRLQIDIIAPKQDFVLEKDKYDVLDERLRDRLLRSFTPGRQPASGADGSYYDVMAAAIESRRHMIKRTLEKELARAVVNHPKNQSRGVFEGPPPSMAFTPGGVKVGQNQAALQALLTLRTQREISRETILEVLGLDQSVEWQRLLFEASVYDTTFKTRVPFSSPDVAGPDAGKKLGDQPMSDPQAPDGQAPAGEPPAVSGKRGGRPPGGGSSPNSPQGQMKPKTGNGNPSTKGVQ